jgi:hypothetical protein
MPSVLCELRKLSHVLRDIVADQFFGIGLWILPIAPGISTLRQKTHLFKSFANYWGPTNIPNTWRNTPETHNLVLDEIFQRAIKDGHKHIAILAMDQFNDKHIADYRVKFTPKENHDNRRT